MPLVLGNSLTPAQRAAVIARYGEQSIAWFKVRIFSFSRSGNLLSVIVIDPSQQQERLA